jgi:hypothetical protein
MKVRAGACALGSSALLSYRLVLIKDKAPKIDIKHLEELFNHF